MKIHPVAEMFPMMAEDELDELADDIKANGLLNPIVLDAEGVLIDGRNRLEACRRADVEPKFEQLDGVDPVAFILSSNDKRRHMSKGARAMVAAKIRNLSFNDKSPRDQTAKQLKVASGYIGQAAVVLEYAPELADHVVAGTLPLNDAYTKAQERKREAESDEFKMARLRKQAPDLADQVSEERLSLAEANAAFLAREQERQEEEKREQQAKETATRLFADTVSLLDPRAMSVEELASNLLEMIDSQFTQDDLSKERLQKALLVFRTIVTKWKDR
jgi:hypothetical protein